MDQQCRAFLQAVADQAGPDWFEMTPVRARESFASLGDLFGLGPTDIEVNDVELEPQLKLRIYRPQGSAGHTTPVMLYFHGGGWVLGDIQTHDALCRRFAKAVGCTLVSVDYRRAPEHPFPGPLDDCYLALQHVSRTADSLHVDPQRIMLAGDSAGATLAAAVALRARDEQGPKILAQILLYPVLDPACDSQSYREFATGFGLTQASMRYFWDCYLPDGQATPYAAPCQATSLHELPPAIIITAGYDVLRDEGESYAARLQAAGVQTIHRRYATMIHGFFHLAGAIDHAHNATGEVAIAARKLAGM